jgi:hypothetical protein
MKGPKMKISTLLKGAVVAAFAAVTLGQMAAADTGNTTAVSAHGAATFSDSNAKEYKIENAGIAFGGNFSPSPPRGGGGCINLYPPGTRVICDKQGEVHNGYRYARLAP